MERFFEATPTFSATGEPGEIVTVEVDVDGDGTPEVTFTTIVDPDGTFFG